MQHIKKIYLYLVSVIALVIMVVGAIMLLNMALKTWVFTKADRNYYVYPACPAVAPASEPASKLDAKTLECSPEQQELQRKNDAENRAAQKQRDAAQALAMIIVATPVWWFHWRLAKREQ